MAEKDPGRQKSGDELISRQRQLRENAKPANGPLVIADSLTFPQNTGGLLRLADAAGCREVILLHDEPQPQLPAKARKIARSTQKSVNWRFHPKSGPDLFEQLKAQNIQPIALELTTQSQNIFSTELPENCAFLIGNERFGLDPQLLSQCEKAVHIPMFGANGSMNVIQALGIALFEWRRQFGAADL